MGQLNYHLQVIDLFIYFSSSVTIEIKHVKLSDMTDRAFRIDFLGANRLASGTQLIKNHIAEAISKMESEKNKRPAIAGKPLFLLVGPK